MTTRLPKWQPNYPNDKQTTQMTTRLKIKELGGRQPRKRASKGCKQKREISLTTPETEQTTLYKNWVKQMSQKRKGNKSNTPTRSDWKTTNQQKTNRLSKDRQPGGRRLSAKSLKKAVILSTKHSKATKTNNWVDKDLSKSPKKK